MAPRCSPLMLGCAAALLCFVCAVVFACLWFTSNTEARCPAGTFRHAAVAADSGLCSDIGRDMLQQGGSAVDGAIAALLCTSVVNPQSMGVGGGSIFTIRNRTGGVKIYNFRETVPKSFQADFLSNCSPDFKIYEGTKWMGVPGELRGYEAVHRAYGKLPWAKLFEPTIKLARGGIQMPDYLATLLGHNLVKTIAKNLCSAQLLCKGQTFLTKGDVMKFPKLADTLEAVAKNGTDVFYRGEIGLDLIKDVQAAGGTMTMEDLKSFQVQEQEAWTVNIGNFKMHLPPPPAGGAMLAFILKVMEEFSLSPDSLKGDQKIQLYQRYVETLKFVNGQKRTIRDMEKNNETSARHLLDPCFIKQIKSMICWNCTHDLSYYNVTPSSDHMGTTHVSILDEDGLAVSATSTINQAFGGGNFSPLTGVILNNELSDFCGRADGVSPGEQPPSSMTPVVLESESGELLVIGGSGGSMIITAVASSIINHLFLGKSLADAVAAPIVFVDSKNNLNFERRFDEAVTKRLQAFGHKLRESKYFFNVVSAVKKEKGCITAVSDKRKNGMASGY